MTHIADYMADAASSVGLNNLIARELSVSPKPQIVCHFLYDFRRSLLMINSPLNPYLLERRIDIFGDYTNLATLEDTTYSPQKRKWLHHQVDIVPL
jgi:hypothetical protein